MFFYLDAESEYRDLPSITPFLFYHFSRKGRTGVLWKNDKNRYSFWGAENDTGNDPENDPGNEPEMRREKKLFFFAKKLSFISCLRKYKEARDFKGCFNWFWGTSKEKYKLYKLFSPQNNPSTLTY